MSVDKTWPPRVVSQFSCGAASAVATKLMLAEHANSLEQVVILNAFIVEEHADNRRFLADCEKWFGHPITVVRDTKYGASTHEVWRRKRYMKGPKGAPCSLELKRKVLAAAGLKNDIWVVGFTAEEEDRWEDLIRLNPGRTILCPLIEKGLSKDDCLAVVDRAGILLPLMYRMGYDNANCLHCPKGGQNYHQKMREDFQDSFVQVKDIQKSIGPGANFLRFRSGPRKGERMSLEELPEGPGNMDDEPSFSCSFFCEMAEQDIRGGE